MHTTHCKTETMNEHVEQTEFSAEYREMVSPALVLYWSMAKHQHIDAERRDFFPLYVLLIEIEFVW